MRESKHEIPAQAKFCQSQKAESQQSEMLDTQGVLSPQHTSLGWMSNRVGNTPSAGVHAAMLSRSTASWNGQLLIQLQRQYGNRYVQKVLAFSRKSDKAAEVIPEFEEQSDILEGSPLGKAIQFQEEEQPEDIEMKSVQPKLVVGQSGDKYEQEADQVADRVMAMSEPESHQQVQRQIKEEEELQMKPLLTSITPLVQRQEGQETEKEELQMKPFQQRAAADGGFEVSSNLESRLNQSQGGGSFLSDEVRSFMEPRFGCDFNQVRIHTGSESVQMNRELGSQAFTYGHDIFFGAGKYDPGASEGKRLLAHELTHVIQQNQGSFSLKTKPSLKHKQTSKPLAESLSAAPTGQPQAAPTVTGIIVGTDLGVGRSITAKATVAPGTPGTALAWTLIGAPAGVNITPNGRKATIQAAAAALASAGGVFQVQCGLTATPGDNFTSPNITLVGITGVTFTANPAFNPIAAVIPATGPVNTADPNRDGLMGNTAVVNAVTLPAGRATTVTLPNSLGATVAGNTITTGTKTGNMGVRVTDNTTGSQRDETLIVNPVPLKLNSFPSQAPVGPYGALNQLGWKRSDSTAHPLNRIVGETITAGARDDFNFTSTINPPIGPNPAPTPQLAVPADNWFDQLITPAGANAGPAGDANMINVNRYEGSAVPHLPRRWILRQGFHYMDWAGNWSDEFDHGIHRRSLIKQGGNYMFRTEHIFPGASAAAFDEPYLGPQLIVLSNVTTTPLAPAATALAADGVATANIAVNSTVAGRLVNWNRVSGNSIAFTAPPAGGAAAVVTPATVTATLVPGKSKVQIADSVFANRQVEATVRTVPVSLHRMRAPVTRVPTGTDTALVNLMAEPGGRIINWTVDAAATTAGVSVLGAALAPALPAQSATVIRPPGFTGRVKVTATDSILPAKKASITITFL